MTQRFVLSDESATVDLGARLATSVEPGALIYLEGDLGAGKTCFARGLIRGLGHAGRVKSPTYAWVEPYNLSKLSLYHFDLYRFEPNTPWRETGFDELFDGVAVCVVEWPERAGPNLPRPDLRIRIQHAVPSGREVEISAETPKGERLMKGLA